MNTVLSMGYQPQLLFSSRRFSESFNQLFDKLEENDTKFQVLGGDATGSLDFYNSDARPCVRGLIPNKGKYRIHMNNNGSWTVSSHATRYPYRPNSDEIQAITSTLDSKLS